MDRVLSTKGVRRKLTSSPLSQSKYPYTNELARNGQGLVIKHGPCQAVGAIKL